MTPPNAPCLTAFKVAGGDVAQMIGAVGPSGG